MKHSGKPANTQPPTREATARMIRSGYKTCFYFPMACIAAAIFFAVGRAWSSSAGFVVLALISFPFCLSSYRSSRQMCEDVVERDVPTPEAVARMIRSSYKVYFYAPVLCMTTAVLFAVGREWLYSAGFVVMALAYLLGLLPSYLSSRKICEDVIQQHEQQHKENTP